MGLVVAWQMKVEEEEEEEEEEERASWVVPTRVS